MPISIHALREEGDLLLPLTAARSSIFLSTPSARRATSRRTSSRSAFGYFYPRPPRGGRHAIHGHRPDACVVFLSTPSARRATLIVIRVPPRYSDFYPRPPRGGRRCLLFSALLLCMISIHALREEGDNYALPLCLRARYFYPRPPRGGRHSIPGLVDHH